MIPAPLRESTQSLVCRSHRIRRVPIDSDARGMCPALPLAGRPPQTEETTSQRLDLNGNRPPRQELQMSPKARSAPLARRLQAAKAEPTKPVALAPNPDRKPVAKPEPAPPPGPKPAPPPVVVPARPRRPPRSRPGRSRRPRLNRPPRSPARPLQLLRSTPGPSWSATSTGSACPRPRSASPTCRRESRAAWGPSPTRTRTTTGGRPWHCGLSAALFRGAMIGRSMTRLCRARSP